jgi:hypothetical protein
MVDKKVSRSKNYNNFRMYLDRIHKIKNSGTLASFLIEKFCNSKTPTGYVKIFVEELRQHGVLIKNDKLYEWREEMTKKFILICKADETSLKEKDANFKASEFKFGKSIKKYIEKGLEEKSSVYEKLDLKADVEDLQNLRMETKLEQEKMKEKIADLELKVDDLEVKFVDFMLYVMPPNNSERRLIVKNNRYNKEECVRQLTENTKNNKDVIN